MRILIAGLFVVAASGVGWAQAQPRPTFDVSVVKPMDLRPDALAKYQTQLWVFSCKGGHFVSTGPPLKNVIRAAYQIRYDFQVPAWADMAGDRYFIEGKTDRALSDRDCWLAVQTMLEDRFKLKLHREAKEGVPAFELVQAKRGTTLREPTPDTPVDPRNGGVWIRGVRYSSARWSSYVIAARLADFPEIGRPIVDKTGLKSQYEFRLDYAARAGEDKPDIFTALQEQLGLKLEPTKISAEFTVIDSMEKPSLEN